MRPPGLVRRTIFYVPSDIAKVVYANLPVTCSGRNARGVGKQMRIEDIRTMACVNYRAMGEWIGSFGWRDPIAGTKFPDLHAAWIERECTKLTDLSRPSLRSVIPSTQ